MLVVELCLEADGTLLRFAIIMPIKNFFSTSLLAPTRSAHYPFLYSIHKRPLSDSSTGTSLNYNHVNCNPSTYSPIPDCLTGTLLNCHSQTPSWNPSSDTTLNCNLAQTMHDMPSSHDGHLGHLGNWTDDMPSGHLNTLLSYWLDDMPSGHPDYFGHLGLLGHLGHPSLLGHLSYLSTIGNLNTLNLEPIDGPLHAFIEEEPT
jgi:hypothetical protein